MNRSVLVALLLLLPLTACGANVVQRAQPEPTAPLLRRGLRAEATGCFALFTATGRRIDSTFYNASPAVQLDSAPLLETDDNLRGQWRRVVAHDTLGGASRTTRGMLPPAWSADSLTDTVRVSFVNGFSGAEFAFRVPARRNRPADAGDTLRGRVSEHWDFGPPYETDRGGAIAVRIGCPAPSAIDHDVQGIGDSGHTSRHAGVSERQARMPGLPRLLRRGTPRLGVPDGRAYSAIAARRRVAL